jgi:DNA-binding response OmpR family regulator
MDISENKNKILIVDDNTDLNSILSDKLKANGFDASSAFDGVDGLDKALKIHPDLILLDVMMPKMDGWAMLEKLRTDDWGKNAKVIMLTVIDDDNNISQGVDKGVYGYLIKTDLKLEDIISQVKSALS